jgi:excisionase family DNA binding protein
MSMEPLLLRPSEVAQLLGISQRKVTQMCTDGELPSIKIGRCVRISRKALDRWIAERDPGAEDLSKIVGIEEGFARRMAG